MSLKEDLAPQKIFSYLIILGIAFIFAIQWGPGSKGCENPVGKSATTAAAMVNGKEIPLRDFTRAYAAQMQYYRAQGNPIPESLAKQVGIPGQILDQLVMVELVSQEAERQGISAPDSELHDMIHANPDFQQDGKFDFSRYQEVLNTYYKKTMPEYEADLRRRLAFQRMMDLVDHLAVVSDDEVKARFSKEGNKAEATYVRFLPSMFSSEVKAPSPAEIKDFKGAHAKEVKEYFDANNFLYQQPEKVRARHILVKAEKDAPPDVKAAAKTKIENLRKEIEGGKDFAAVAKANSDDPGSKDNGGELGFNDRQSWVPEFSQVAFGLKVGELSQPVESPFGFHLIQVEEKKPEEKKTLAQVEDDIAKQLLIKAKAKDIARANADKALAAAKSGKSLTQMFPAEKEGQPAAMRFETESKPEAVATGEFSSGEALPHLGPAPPQLSNDVFAGQAPTLLDKVYSVADGYVVAQVTARKLPSDTEFTAQREKLRAEALKAKQVELRESFVKGLKKAGTVQTNLDLIGQAADRS